MKAIKFGALMAVTLMMATSAIVFLQGDCSDAAEPVSDHLEIDLSDFHNDGPFATNRLNFSDGDIFTYTVKEGAPVSLLSYHITGSYKDDFYPVDSTVPSWFEHSSKDLYEGTAVSGDYLIKCQAYCKHSALYPADEAIFYLSFKVVPVVSIMLSYDLNGGHVADGSEIDSQLYSGFELSHDFSLSTKIPVKDGFHFAGWGITPDVAKFAPGANVTFTQSTKIYAVWSSDVPTAPSNQFRLVFDVAGGHNGPDTLVAYSSDSYYVFTVPGKTPSCNDMYFQGWILEGNDRLLHEGDRVKVDVAEGTVYGALTLKANYSDKLVPDPFQELLDFITDPTVIVIGILAMFAGALVIRQRVKGAF